MKNKHLTIIVIGLILFLITCLSKYQSNIITALLWGFFVFIWLLLFLTTLYRNISQYIKDRTINFLTTYLILAFTVIICAIEYKIQNDFNKPSLLKVFYDGDFNGTAIDFKEDGTYIFDNSAIGMSNYTYGNYKISGNKIILDKAQIENVILTDNLEIRAKLNSSEETDKDEYLYQIDKNGNTMTDETFFRVVINNRK